MNKQLYLAHFSIINIYEFFRRLLLNFINHCPEQNNIYLLNIDKYMFITSINKIFLLNIHKKLCYSFVKMYKYIEIYSSNNGNGNIYKYALKKYKILFDFFTKKISTSRISNDYFIIETSKLNSYYSNIEYINPTNDLTISNIFNDMKTNYI